MQAEFKLPELGENIDSGNVVKVLVSVGDKVEKDQTVLELETDKATIEVPSSVTGVVREIHVQEGGKASVGQVVMTVDSDAQPAAEEKPKEEKKKPSTESTKNAAATKPAEQAKASESAPVKKAEQKKPAEGKEVEVKVPDLGEGIESAAIVKALVSEGDSISKDQPVLELETDKAAFELPSNAAGVVRKIHVKEGDKVKVGQTVLTVAAEAGAEQTETAKDELPGGKQRAAVAAAPQPVTANDQEVAEKQRETVYAHEAGAAEAEETKAEGESKEPLPAGAQTKPELPVGAPKQLAPAGPSVRRLAREIGIDINQVSGSGPRGRISIDDIKKHARLANQNIAARPAAGAGIAIPPLPDFSKWGPIERTPMTNVRLRTAERLSVAWISVPRVTQYDKADITELEDDRKKFSSKVEVAGGKLTVTAILLKVVASALKTFPQFNSSVDMSRNEIIYKKYYHIGVAVDTERGLLVPVVRNVDKKNILQLSVDLSELAEKARKKKLTLEEMQGGTFTITNLGGIGGTGFSPIVNYPEAAILGVSRGSMEPVYIDGKFEPRLMLPISLSYDHRVIDGADAARFLRWIAEAVKDPFLLALEG